MRASALPASSAPILFAVTPLAGLLALGSVAHADPLTCQRAITKASARYAQARMKALHRCHDKVVKRAAVLPCPDAKTLQKITKAGTKLQTAVDKACGGADRSCGTGGDDDSLASIGWNGGVCANFESGSCSNTIANCDGVSDCLLCVDGAAVDQAIALYYDEFDLVTTNSTIIKCQRAIGKFASKFFQSKSKALRRCEDRALLGISVGPCPDASTLSAINKAETKKRTGICKKCGGADGACGGVDDLTPSAIGFAATCPDVTIPGGAACGGPIGDLSAIVDCVDCVTEFKADCLDPISVPGIRSYPPECNGGAPVATTTPTPIPDTPTATPPPGGPTLTQTPGAPTATRTPTPVVTATPGPNCGNNTVDAGEDCDGTDDAACTGQCSPACTCPATCALPNPLPEIVTFVSKPGADLDSGWSGQAHDLVTAEDAPLIAARLIGCNTNTASPNCGTCGLQGPVLFPGPAKNCFCYNLASPDNSSLAICDPELAGACGSESCECFLGPPLPITSGGVPVCVVNRMTQPLTGTANMADSGPHAGEGESIVRLESAVYTGVAVEQPCPTCENDPTPRDGVKGGTCSGGINNTDPCDGAGPHDFFGMMSHDCQPLFGANIGKLDIRLNPATTGTTSLGTAGVKCTAPGFTTLDCFCDTCATSAAEPCNSNADCAPGVACGGRRCIGGGNVGAPCTVASQCPGGSCGRPGLATKPNECDDAVCSSGLDPGNPNDGVCAAGPFDTFCSIETFRGCANDSE